jgi:hypothetical protein
MGRRIDAEPSFDRATTGSQGRRHRRHNRPISEPNATFPRIPQCDIILSTPMVEHADFHHPGAARPPRARRGRAQRARGGMLLAIRVGRASCGSCARSKTTWPANVALQVRSLTEGEQVSIGVFQPSDLGTGRCRPHAVRILLEECVALEIEARGANCLYDFID